KASGFMEVKVAPIVRGVSDASPVHVRRLDDTAKGNRPSFAGAAPPEAAEPLYEAFCAALRGLGVPVATGVFGARMAVDLVNDGPVTVVLE
ncbi:MAG TPA: D-aminoacyl-tRNA deacylase, partial [Gaiellaceae bacterium]|nr:D-aminoacyl-tRNA deacylase [Gaiellaceae bacterium]